MAQREGLRQLAQLAVTLMERRLADRAKGAFIGHMSHEMRTPMNAILGFGQLIALGATPGTRVALQAEHVVAAGRHLLELIDESLELMRLEAGGLRWHVQRLPPRVPQACCSGPSRPACADKDTQPVQMWRCPTPTPHPSRKPGRCTQSRRL